MALIDKPICRIGFACVLSDGSLSTNHTLRLASLTETRLAETAHQNLDDLERILFLMAQGPLRLIRLGGSTIPLASHESMTFDWRPFVAGRLRAIGGKYVPMGFRFSSHPGQYTILNSPDALVVQRAEAELVYSVDLLDLMGLDGSHKVVIHGGGIYNDRPASTERLIANLKTLPEKVRRRLILENDERLFSLSQILEVGEAAGLPVCFDLHHHQINPGEEELVPLLERVAKTWDCRPKLHMSSQRPQSRVGAHDDLLHERDMATLTEILPFEADVMVEAKAKEVAAVAAWEWWSSRGVIRDGCPR
ncbi:MAG: UV DNA damage repair endonuclease UvsE [Fimbriimonas sp.]